MRVISNLKQVRTSKNMTLKTLARKSGVSTSHINDIEKNYKNPSIEVLILLAKALDVKVEDLYTVKW